MQKKYFGDSILNVRHNFATTLATRQRSKVNNNNDFLLLMFRRIFWRMMTGSRKYSVYKIKTGSIMTRYSLLIKYCVFFEDFKIFRTLAFLCFVSVSVCVVYTQQAGRPQALQQNWQSSEKSQNFKEKTQYLMNTLYIHLYKHNHTEQLGVHIYSNLDKMS